MISKDMVMPVDVFVGVTTGPELVGTLAIAGLPPRDRDLIRWLFFEDRDRHGRNFR